MGKKKVSRKAASKQPTTEYPVDSLHMWFDLNRDFDELEYARKMIEGASQLLYFFFHCKTVLDMKEVLHVNCGRVMALDACAIFMKEKLEKVRQDANALYKELKRRDEATEAIGQQEARERAERAERAARRARVRRPRRRP